MRGQISSLELCCAGLSGHFVEFAGATRYFAPTRHPKTDEMVEGKQSRGEKARLEIRENAVQMPSDNRSSSLRLFV